MKKRILIKVSGGIGDFMIILPAIKELSKTYYVDILSRAGSEQDFNGGILNEVLKYNPYVSKIIHHEDYILYKKMFRRYDRVGLAYLYYLDQEQTLIKEKQRYKYAAEQLGVYKLTTDHTDIDFFLQEDEINNAKNILKKYKKTVIITPVQLRKNEWLNEGKYIHKDKWDEIIKNCPNYTFVLLGSSSDCVSFDYPNVLNLIDKTSIRESIAILNVADYYILPDGFLNHAAGGMNKTGISIFGISPPYIYGYECSTNLWYHPGCAPCGITDPNYMFMDRYCCMRYTGIPVKTEEVIQVMSEEL